jgi:NAD(P)-dependent dehydrogenase (short-subunit alcohol dehydrogenase family)
MNSVAVVTGADRGLGFALTQNLLEQGWRVFAGRYLDWPELAGLVARFPDTLRVVDLDVSSDESVKAAASQVAAATDSVDLLIANAAINRSAHVESVRESPDFEDMRAEFNVNALGPLRTVEAFLPLLDAGRGKRLCFVSSEAGSIGASTRTGWFGYCMSKAALNMAVKNLFNDLGPKGYTFRLYQPGWMRTYMQGTKNLEADLEPEEGAGYALSYFLGEDAGDLRLHCWDGSDMPW